MERTDEGYRLSTGRTIYANQGILGLSPKLRAYQGYDGGLEYDPDPDAWDDPDDPQPRFTAEERREISDFMQELWEEWKDAR